MNDDMKFDYDEIKGLLETKVLTVLFTKTDGSDRLLRCTLRKDLLPQLGYLTSVKQDNRERLAVWDVENDGWRSFRLDSIKTLVVAPNLEEVE